jgi:hypothetical protein
MARHPLMKESSIELFNCNPQKIEPQNPLAQTIRLRMQVGLIEFDKLNLQILYIPNEIDASFITSDVPFFIIADPIKSSIPGLEDTFRSTFSYAWFPVSPKTLVFLSKRDFSSQYEEVSDAMRILKINLELASSANTMLIANNSSIFNSLP